MVPGSRTSPAAIQVRLHRVEGQVRGISRMIEEDAACIDILTQVAAATRALQSVALLLLDDHLHQCLHQPGDDHRVREERVQDAARAIARLVRS
ncbi:metal-sensitive transcriptional regulator [Ornithinimicrobium sp. W1665]|uniref:metal-sensitive transcriptional regulator n=1 Tax=Ornithinimicrobium sp. W1665 TaxID=3416666 RepID=UPI003CF2037C